MALCEPDTPSDRAYVSTELPLLLGQEQERSSTIPLKRNMQATASIWSTLTFSWLSELLSVGAKRSLEHSDLYDLQNFDSTERNGAILLAAWEREVRLGRKSFIRAFHYAFGGYFWRTGLLKLINDGCIFLNPVLINVIVKYVNGEMQLSTSAAVLCAIGMFASNTLQSLALGQYFFRGYRLSLHVKAAVGQLVYVKALSLDHRQRQAFGVGAIVSYMQIDASKLGDAIPYLHVLWSGPLQLIISLLMLYNYLGPSGFAGLIVMVGLMPLNKRVGKQLAKMTAGVMRTRDDRVKFSNEILQGMRILKLFAWEMPFINQLRKKRDIELKKLRSNMLLGAVMSFLFTATPVLVSTATFAMYTILGNHMTAANAFTALSLLNILRFPILVIPMMLNNLISMLVVHVRLSKFMSAPDRDVRLLEQYSPLDEEVADGSNVIIDGSFSTSSLTFAGHVFVRERATAGVPAIELFGCDFKWPEAPKEDPGKTPKSDKKANKSKSWLPWRRRRVGLSDDALLSNPEDEANTEQLPSTLRAISLRAISGTLVGVAGPVGSGKTSLLCSILGDVPRNGGRVVIRGSIAYCAQEPWIQNASLRDNVLFGQPYDAHFYARVLSACALEADLAILAHGDSTEIGERGINLSGGQKARVALARACYARADVYLLDDVLSAVDAEVGAHLVLKCVRGLLTEMGCTVVLVTHHTHWLHVCDHVLMLKANGTIEQQGPPSELTSLPRANSNSTLSALSHEEEIHEHPPTAASAVPGGLSAKPESNHVPLSVKDPPTLMTGRNTNSEGTNANRNTASATASTKESTKEVLKHDSKSPPSASSKLVLDEQRERGTVSKVVWLSYARALGWWSILFVLVLYAISQASTMLSSWWLGEWAASDQSGSKIWFYLGVYSIMTLAASVLIYGRSIANAVNALRASRYIHEKAMVAVVRAPIAFFDSNPLGRIINRFSVDLQKVDTAISPAAGAFVMYGVQLIGTIAVMVANAWEIVVCMLPLTLFYISVASYYRRSSRELQRLDAISKSPIYTSFSECLNGALTIQAFGANMRFALSSRNKFDYNMRAGFVAYAANRWLSVRLEFLSNILLAATAFVSIITVRMNGTGPRAAGMAGLALSYAPGMTDNLNWMLRQFTTLETNMVSVERLEQYSHLEGEEHLSETQFQPVEPEWPQHGGIKFDEVCMRYRENLPDVLAGLTLEIGPAEKIGIVGRTGAGKSSILVCLFRMCELRAGSISIDGLDVSKLPLHKLRSRLAIIPQDPIMFSGTLRTNLDPFDEHLDEELWETLRQCSIDEAMQAHPAGLARPIEEKGSNLSMGQRQLVCMARAFLKRTRILVLDEATASVDMSTDEIIQETLRRELSHATVLTIAHRLDTVMHCDRVVVMHEGKVAEVGAPIALRETAGSRFAELWDARAN